MTLRRPQRRIFALAACLLFLVGGLLARQHQASTNHGYCSEHGELVHLHDLAAGSVAEARPARSALLPAVPFEGEHGCLALHLLATPFVGGGEPAATPLHTPQAARQRGVAHHAHTPIAILLTAPKNSPPRV